MRVYLCGAINGCTDEECRGWREAAKLLLVGHEVLDPMSRDYRGVEGSHVSAIVEGDLADIRKSDVLLVKADRASWGTAMEVVYAKSVYGARVMAFGAGDRPSPWLAFHAEMYDDLEQACAAIQGSV